jgi:hypothetical protein
VPDVANRQLGLGRVGHDTGRLVLHFERRVALPCAQVRDTLTARGLDGVPGAERWDVDDEGRGSRLVFTAWLDADDVETAAGRGAAYHQCFARLVGTMQPGTNVELLNDLDPALLVAAYRSAFAAALADTD